MKLQVNCFVDTGKTLIDTGKLVILKGKIYIFLLCYDMKEIANLDYLYNFPKKNIILLVSYFLIICFLVNEFFSGTPIYPSMGNHESFPCNNYPTR